MEYSANKRNIFQRIWHMLLAIGPGLFCIGYTIGTGSVTSMLKAGSQYGMKLLWVLALSCFFSWTLMEAYGRYAVITGKTTAFSFKTELSWGPFLGILLIIGIVLAQWSALSGIVGLTSAMLYEVVRLFFPGLTPANYWSILGIAIAILIIMYALIIVGKFSFFEKVLVVFVTVMGISFVISMFMVFPDLSEIASGLTISIPSEEHGKLMVAAFVGTTMAAPTFVVRPLLMQGKHWGRSHGREQRRDAFFSAFLMFTISASVMVTATGVFYSEGRILTAVIDMLYTLEPVAGKFSVALFVTGALSAGLSSVFPILMVAPLLIADYQDGKLDTRSKLFRILTAIGCVVGLSVPLMGANPILAQVATQVANVFVLPLVIGGIIYLINQPRLMGEERAGWLLNIGLITAFIFSCIISYTGILGLGAFF